MLQRRSLQKARAFHTAGGMSFADCRATGTTPAIQPILSRVSQGSSPNPKAGDHQSRFSNRGVDLGALRFLTPVTIPEGATGRLIIFLQWGGATDIHLWGQNGTTSNTKEGQGWKQYIHTLAAPSCPQNQTWLCQFSCCGVGPIVQLLPLESTISVLDQCFHSANTPVCDDTHIKSTLKVKRYVGLPKKYEKQIEQVSWTYNNSSHRKFKNFH